MQFFEPLFLLSIRDTFSDSSCAYQMIFVPRLAIGGKGGPVLMREDFEPAASEVWWYAKYPTVAEDTQKLAFIVLVVIYRGIVKRRE